jgi:hypothetical protein
MPNTASTPVLFAVRGVPIEAFGGRHGRQTRKFVLMILASYANPDGTRCFPSLSRLSRDCGLQKRSIQKVIRWLRENGFLEIAYKAGPNHTNAYAVLIPEVVNSSIHDEPQRSWCPEEHEVGNSSIQGGGDRKHTGGELQSSPNLPITIQLPTKRPTKGAPKSSAPFVMPDWIPVQEWKDFVEMRRKNRKLMSDGARELIIRRLAELRDAGDTPSDVLNQSTRNCWQDVFPLKRDRLTRRATTEKLSELNHRSSYGLTSGTNVGKL